VLFVGDGRRSAPVAVRPGRGATVSGRRELWRGKAMKGRLVKDTATLLRQLKWVREAPEGNISQRSPTKKGADETGWAGGATERRG
jgi:hypothetical protein